MQNVSDSRIEFRFLKKLMEIKQMDSGLLNQKKEAEAKRCLAEIRLKDLQRKSSALKESFSKFDSFLKDNDEKKTRAVKKAAQESLICVEKTQELSMLKTKHESLKSCLEAQEKILKSGTMYQQYLDKVVEQNGFLEIREVLQRYEALDSAAQELRARIQDADSKCETKRGELQVLKDEITTKTLFYGNQIADLKVRLDLMRVKSSMWQNNLDESMMQVTQKNLELGQLQMATNNLHELVQKQLHGKSEVSDTTVKLDKIQHFILDLSEITSK